MVLIVANKRYYWFLFSVVKPEAWSHSLNAPVWIQMQKVKEWKDNSIDKVGNLSSHNDTKVHIFVLDRCAHVAKCYHSQCKRANGQIRCRMRYGVVSRSKMLKRPLDEQVCHKVLLCMYFLILNVFDYMELVAQLKRSLGHNLKKGPLHCLVCLSWYKMSVI